MYFRKFPKAEFVDFSMSFTTVVSIGSDHFFFSHHEAGLIIRVTKEVIYFKAFMWSKGAFNEN